MPCLWLQILREGIFFSFHPQPNFLVFPFSVVIFLVYSLLKMLPFEGYVIQKTFIIKYLLTVRLQGLLPIVRTLGPFGPPGTGRCLSGHLSN